MNHEKPLTYLGIQRRYDELISALEFIQLYLPTIPITEAACSDLQTIHKILCSLKEQTYEDDKQPTVPTPDWIEDLL